LCGMGVTSSIEAIRSPAACRAEMADSRPEPGPLTLISTSRTPLRRAALAHCCAACWAAKGVLLREPLKPTWPAELEQIVFPFGSVIVIKVLLKVAFMCATARAIFLLIFRLVLFAIIFSCPCVVLYSTQFAAWFVVWAINCDYRFSFTPFLPATVFLGPLRVRALLWVLWPLTGNPFLWRIPL